LEVVDTRSLQSMQKQGEVIDDIAMHIEATRNYTSAARDQLASAVVTRNRWRRCGAWPARNARRKESLAWS